MINTHHIKNNRLGILLLVCFSILSCTDLEIEETDSRLQEGFNGIETAEEAANSVGALYNSLNGYIGDQANLYALTEVTTDEQLVPTRGSDWGDNGIWRQMHQHSWTPDHNYITNVWNQWNELQLGASEVIDERSASSDESRAQAYFLRALGMYVILDNFGQVPYRDTAASPLDDPEVLTGDDAINFIVSDLENAISGLPIIAPGDGNNRAGKAAARYLLAKTLLNKHIFNGSGTANPADMDQVVSLVDQIANDGYGLVAGYFDIFKEDMDNETIWYIPTSVGNRIWNGLHYNQITPEQSGGWNGFSTLAEFYDLFEGDPNVNTEGSGQEERRGFVPDIASDNIDETNYGIGYGFLISQQYSVATNEDGDIITPLEPVAATDRGGSPLGYTRDFTNASTGEPSLTDNDEVSGIRVIKYHPANGAFKEHEIFFRYSDAHLMKAEAIMRGGGDPTALVNELRTLRGASELTGISEQGLLDERGRELYTEFWRRNDMIRFGQYNKDWDFKDPDAVGNSDRNLFPIPASQLPLNPNLVQNPGY
ncbi:RagB/SusD family nutrient uptake outer membrane protein [Galbibacter sp. EGI 63066]|uniref:RagB/SusD family nutrient uptake outer membrane protein n=1 Tax=Galbibacter sp. EGI 63066 TaxID=2993559 RepID=UPI002248FEE3|nr:RagB/SusD family nutrient uptake outer membrane protein [Galbibacter sp. EGI 63066]MCX2679900.1 RagB/SusD family nutrient uptake outer membrane protein [Galbibacter sp. EGI 63066]